MNKRRILTLTTVLSVLLSIYPVSLLSAGELPPGSITAHKFNDANSNGVQDDGEQNIEGWVIRLYTWMEGNLQQVAEGTTAPDGTLTFTNLSPGKYKVWEEIPQCWEPTTPGDHWNGGYYTLVDLNTDQQAMVQFGNVYTCTPLLETCIDLDKTGPDTVHRGETITYHFRVHNCGDVILSGGAQVYDPLFGPDPIWSDDLEPGQVHKFNMVYTLPDDHCGEFTNKARAVGHPPGYSAVTDQDSWTVMVICAEPATLILEPDEATNELPTGTSHPFTATVLDQYGNPMEEVLVSFRTDFGHIQAGGQYTQVPTDESGQATVTVVSTVAGMAHIRAWVDDGDDTYTENELTDEPSTKTWIEVQSPCLKIKRILDGAFTNPINGQDLETVTELIHVSDGTGIGWPTRFHLTIKVENCGDADLTNVVVTDVIENQVAPRDILGSSGGLVDGLRPNGDNVFGRDVITWTIGSFPAGQSAYLELLIETLQDSTDKYAPTSQDQDIEINRGTTVQATTTECGIIDATTNSVTRTLDDSPEKSVDDGHISLIIPSLPDRTPWVETACESVTVATLDPASPDGANGWYRTPVTVTLSTPDAQSSMGYTVYQVNHSHWQTYTTPITVTAQGTTTVAYYSMDARGNVEKVQTITVKIDTTPPSSEANVSPVVYNSPIAVNWTATDTASGVASASLWYKFETDGEWANSGQKVQDENSGIFYFTPIHSDGTYCFATQSTDKAGNAEPQPIGAEQTCCEYKEQKETDDYYIYLPLILRTR